MDELEFMGRLSEDGKSIRIQGAMHYGHLLGPLRDRPLKITVEEYENNQTDRQRRYVFGVVIPDIQKWFLETSGERHDKDFVYAWIRQNLLGHKLERKIMAGCEVFAFTEKTISKMNVKDFHTAIDTIIKEMALRGCYVREPKGGNFLHELAGYPQ